MRKTPSYLKGLAEDRARADGDAIRLQGLLAELAPVITEAKRTLSLHEESQDGVGFCGAAGTAEGGAAAGMPAL